MALKYLRMILVSFVLLGVCACATPDKTAASVYSSASNLAMQSDAKQMLITMLNQYAQGEISLAQQWLEEDMMGRQVIIDNMQQSHTQQKQIELKLSDTTMAQTNDTVMIQITWEKRFLRIPTMQAQLKQGKTQFLLTSKHAIWKLVGMSGDNVFAP